MVYYAPYSKFEKRINYEQWTLILRSNLEMRLPLILLREIILHRFSGWLIPYRIINSLSLVCLLVLYTAWWLLIGGSRACSHLDWSRSMRELWLLHVYEMNWSNLWLHFQCCLCKFWMDNFYYDCLNTSSNTPKKGTIPTIPKHASCIPPF